MDIKPYLIAKLAPPKDFGKMSDLSDSVPFIDLLAKFKCVHNGE